MTFHPQEIVDQSNGWGGHFDNCAKHAILGLAKEHRKVREECGANEVSQVEDCVFTSG